MGYTHGTFAKAHNKSMPSSNFSLVILIKKVVPVGVPVHLISVRCMDHSSHMDLNDRSTTMQIFFLR